MHVSCRNVSFATVEGLGAAMSDGAEVTVSGERTRELLHRVTVLERPLERFVFVPGRRNDVFAQMAEALWVMAGRDDLPWLERYLPRAGEFSDDGGQTWRGAYGPRLRGGNGRVDQFAQVRRLLLEDRSTRRAVMTLFNPAVDLEATVDIPCNNWLAWLLRDGALHLAVAVRSNDVVWGFSGANAFEWSVLHEAMARWVGAAVGRQTWLASSFHVYERHWGRASDIVSGFRGLTPYDFGILRPPFEAPWPEFDGALAAWFDAEEAVRSDPEAPLPRGRVVRDPLLADWLEAIRVRWGADAWPASRLRRELAALPATDAAAATWERFARQDPGILEAVAHPALAAYFAAVAGSAPAGDGVSRAVKRLHARKDRAYGAAWKRRGELVSVLPNIARKVDRLEVFLERGLRTGDEALLDTALDLYVYATKYRLLLEERAEPTGLLPGDAPTPYSDHDANFDGIVDVDAFGGAGPDVRTALRNAVDIFARLWPLAGSNGNLDASRELVDGLRDAARAAVSAIARDEPGVVREFIAGEARLAASGGGSREAGGPG